MEAHLGALEVHIGALEAHPREVVPQPGAVRAPLNQKELHYYK
jgi:hypothetical protein